jgi:RNA polymerase primary sigma factor
MINNIKNAEEKLTNQLGRKPSISELANALSADTKDNYSQEKIIELKRISVAPVSLDKELRTDDESHVSDFIKDEVGDDPEKSFIGEEKNKIIFDAMKKVLESDEFMVMKLRTGVGSNQVDALSLDETAKVMGLTRDAVRNKEMAA